MRISYSTKTNTLGPGMRYAIWFQGCQKRCKGCINPEGQAVDGGYEISVDEILQKISKLDDIVGITISGGEPFLQYEELRELIIRIKTETKLDIMLFSGYTLEYLKIHFPDCLGILQLVDIFVDGEYVQEKNDNSMYRGSNNQNIYYFTNKYVKYSSDIDRIKSRQFSFEVKEGGDIFFVGIPPKGFYENFLEKIGGQD